MSTSSLTQSTQEKLHVPPEIAQLRERIYAYEDETQPWRRGVIATQVWQELEHEPLVLKKAEVIARCFEQIKPALLPEDRFAGFVFRRLQVHNGVSSEDAWRRQIKHPEIFGYNPNWPIPEEIHNIFTYWRDHPPKQPHNPYREKHKWLTRYGIANPNAWIGGHTLPDHNILLEAGIPGMIKHINERLAQPTDDCQHAQLRAMKRILEAMRTHCRICVQEANTVAIAEKRGHLQTVAENCAQLADGPPQTLAQSLQLLFFSNCADILDTDGDATSFGRIDQLLQPFYENELKDGTITPQRAFELICFFLAKNWRRQTSNNMCVGGIRPDGSDGTNDLSILFLKALPETNISCDLSARVHGNAPESYWESAASAMSAGLGRGGIYNDDVTIPALERKEIASADARDYAPLGCVEVMIPGRTSFRTMCFSLNPLKVLELVINHGTCQVTGETVWPDIPDGFSSFEELHAEYRRRMQEVVDAGIEILHEDERTEVQHSPRPWLSLLSHGGIADALDLSAGQPKYNPVAVSIIGLADVVNALYALQRLVFHEQRLRMEQLRTILNHDWAGQPTLRQEVLNRFPRYGQGDPRIGALAAREASGFAECFEGYRTFYGDRFWPLIFGVTAEMADCHEPRTGASPAGKLKGETLAHSLQPSPQGSRGCLSDILEDNCAVDFSEFPGGISNVQECDRRFITGAYGLNRLVDLLKGYCGKGGMELSVNFLSADELRRAQQRPEEYPNLMVRLFGLSAYFVSLDKNLQEKVITRALNMENKV